MNMTLSFPMMLLLLGYIVCFGEIVNLNNHFVNAETLQNLRDFEIEKQLKVVNKSAVKIIKTTHGDTYECVDFYKQPVFDHPSMKNHLFHYKIHRTSSKKQSKANNKNFGYLWENGVGCPIGTVPIKTVTKNELLTLNLFSEKYKPQGSWNFTYNQYNVDTGQHHFAVSRTRQEIRKSYDGATMIMSINDPKVISPQISSARMHIQIGDDFIQTGWTINPKLYSDSKTRSYVYTKAGENQCYNSMCSAGIVQVRSDFPLGSIQEPPNVRGSIEIYYDTYCLIKDKTNGNWWFEFNGVEIGFWPANRFQQSFANNIEWGGEVYSAFMPSPQMGNGYFPVKHPAFDAFIFNISIVDENFKIDKKVKNTETFSDNTRGYDVIDRKNDIYPRILLNHVVYFGGPGNI